MQLIVSIQNDGYVGNEKTNKLSTIDSTHLSL